MLVVTQTLPQNNDTTFLNYQQKLDRYSASSVLSGHITIELTVENFHYASEIFINAKRSPQS
jgi:hypothetical protein